jgi:hypothetical protein
MLKKIGLGILLLVLIILVSFIFLSTSKQIHWLDIDSDNIEERFELSSGQLQVWKQEQLVFASEIAYNVNHFTYGDANNDGRAELLVGFWRIGDYGIDNNYARKRRDPLASYHLYQYQYQPDARMFRLIWGSSTLNDPLYSFSLIESETDNTILRVTTGSYQDYDNRGKITPINTSDWIWDQWYFKEI